MAAFENLKSLAFKKGPGVEANQLIDDVRQSIKAEHGSSVNYEVVLIGRSWDYVRSVVAPRLALFLRSKRFDVEHCAPVFLSIFIEDTLYFVHAQDFYRELRLAEGLPEDVFASLVRAWEQTGKPLAGVLPPGRPSRDAS